MKGKLFGLGVGPGDPELLTLKALRLIRESAVSYTHLRFQVRMRKGIFSVSMKRYRDESWRV